MATTLDDEMTELPDPPDGWEVVVSRANNRDAPVYYKKGREKVDDPEIRFRNGEFVGFRESGAPNAVFSCPTLDVAIVAYELMF